ncbi:LamG domain-containing protein [Motiliproteus sp. MSK22-1]|uniref:LamG domain-containing protein n=1 Tax=Motiliproteus sp. MSK22-1 TaxID=1897630 RepID=UPI00097720B3|nr:LamG domain-containing protein [Motiliproteus sp. MSK22-1]OMH38968.1 hypothetical protein BGP75_04375 [Motiliproteus sp. MSK22-1]
MKLLRTPALLLSLLASNQAFSTETGTISNLIMSGPHDWNHPNMVQIDFGSDVMNTAGCSKRYAGIRQTEDNSHLVSLAIAAQMSQRDVHIELNPDDVYYPAENRCSIYRLSLAGYSDPGGEPPPPPPANDEDVLAPDNANLKLHYSMENIVDSTLIDETGNFNITLNGATETAGYLGQGLHFDGEDDYGTADLAALGTLDAITVSFWAKMRFPNRGPVALIAQPFDVHNQFNIHFSRQGGKLYWDFGDVARQGRAGIRWNRAWEETWTHFTFTAGTDGLNIYVNGNLEASRGKAQSVDFSQKTLGFMHHTRPGDSAANFRRHKAFMNGDIDQLRIFNRGLTPQEVNTLYSETLN